MLLFLSQSFLRFWYVWSNCSKDHSLAHLGSFWGFSCLDTGDSSSSSQSEKKEFGMTYEVCSSLIWLFSITKASFWAIWTNFHPFFSKMHWIGRSKINLAYLPCPEDKGLVPGALGYGIICKFMQTLERKSWGTTHHEPQIGFWWEFNQVVSWQSPKKFLPPSGN